MSDLISAKEAVVEIVNNALHKILSGEQTLTREYEQSVLNAVKMVLDATQPEIIHCKDCKWKQGSECVRFAEVRPFPDGFCSLAERRINDSD